MDKVRFGIIGIGNMGSKHAKSLFEGKIQGAQLAAICDTNPGRLDWARQEFGDAVELFDSDEGFWQIAKIDAVIIAVPHYEHPPLAIHGLELGYHVLTEKPAGVYTKAVRRMNEAAAAHPGQVFGIMYNQRTNPLYQKVRELLQDGELGDLKRVVWIITTWYRSQSYYNSGGWRATWAGEGGGVLLNQCPHNLDLWQWICGMPRRIRAEMYFGKYHDIEVEDDVTAFAEYENGATGVFITSTHEAPGTNRLELSCDRGKVVVENGRLAYRRNRIGEREFNATYTGGFGTPECWDVEIPIKGVETAHNGILQNFTDAILKGMPLLAPGEEGIRGLTISNAMHLSAWTGGWVDLNEMDEELFYQLLQQRIAASKGKDAAKAVQLDTEGSY